ncbi:MAG: hypothetical protein I3275_05430 [Candidatus Moeniiplasma glomeromycotorum]|nr:hypothetical protein [Candidatus Moeniiplasma glomeromycotorum]
MSNNNKKIFAQKVKSDLTEEIKKIATGEIKPYQFYDKITYNYNGENGRGTILTWKNEGIAFITTQENYEKSNSEEIKKWGWGINKEHYAFVDPEDWTEIINLIKQKDQLKKVKMAQWEKERDQKLNNSPNLFWWDACRTSLVITKGMRKFYDFLGWENGQIYYLSIAKNHPDLNNFSPKEVGFYQIEGVANLPIEKAPAEYWSDGGKNNPCNFGKWVEFNNRFTITPYQVESGSELPEKNLGCDTCYKRLEGGSNHDEFYIMKRYHGKIGGSVIWACLDCYPNKEKEYLQNYETIFKRFKDKTSDIDYQAIKSNWVDCYAGKKDQSGKVLKQENCPHCQPWKQHKNTNSDKKRIDIETLIKYFQDYQIKEIEWENGKLTITHNNNNNNETVDEKEINNNQEFQNINNFLADKDDKKITLEELKKELEKGENKPDNSQKNTPNSPEKTNYTPYVIGGSVIIIVLLVAGYWLKKTKKKKK